MSGHHDVAAGDSVADILKMALPLGMAILAVIGNTMIDILMIGRLGVEAVAAATLGMQLFLVAVVASQGIVMAFPPLYSQALGLKQTSELPKIFGAAISVLVPLSVVVFLLLWFGDALMTLTGQDAALVRYSEDYGNVVAFAIFPALLQSLLWEVNSIYGKSRYIALVSIVSFACNILFNWLLIYGNGGFPAMGIAGAALSTAFTAGVSATLLLLPFRTKLHVVPGMFTGITGYAKKIISLGIPIAVSEGVTVGFFVAATFVVGLYGEQALAAHVIAFQVSELAIVFAIAFSEVASIKTGLAATSFSQADFHRLLRRLIVTTLAVSLVMVAGLVIGNGIIPQWYLPGNAQADIDVRAQASVLILLAAGFTLFDSLQFVLLGSLRGMQDTRVPMVITIIGYWGIGLPGGLALAEWAGLGVTGIWIGLTIGLVFVALPLSWRLWGKARYHQPLNQQDGLSENKAAATF